jgi:hypothetical protein
MKIIRVGEQETRLEYVIQPDWGGRVGKNLAWLSVRSVASNLARITQIQVHFLGLRGLDTWDEKDGEATAEVLMAKTKEEKLHGHGESSVEARMKELMGKQKGLEELGEKHEWFEALLTKIVENELRPAGDSKAKLCNMSKKEANIIGGALASCIAANLTAPAAVDEWILRYPAMGELEREYVCERAERAQKRASGSGAPTTDANNRARKTAVKDRASAPTSDSNERAEGAGERTNNFLLLALQQAPSLALVSLAWRANDFLLLCSLRLLPFISRSPNPPPPPPPGTCGSGP